MPRAFLVKKKRRVFGAWQWKEPEQLEWKEEKHRDNIHTESNETQVGQSTQVKDIRAGQVITRGGKLDSTWLNKGHKTEKKENN